MWNRLFPPMPQPRNEAERRARYWELARNVLMVVGLIVLYFMQPHLPVFVNEVVRSIMQPDGQVRLRWVTLDPG